MKHMTRLLGPLAAVALIVGSLVATELVPDTSAADAAKGRVYLIGIPGAT
ncbi:MAG: hypothetical protein HZA91_09720 [Verrucomicrobia bacterium]|nr:hypothetical protein [Verrucomicrobiota bacterium]